MPIKSFKCRYTEALFHDESSGRFGQIERRARRKLLRLHAAKVLGDLSVTPADRVEALKGDRQGQHSIRINDQWRICFVWKDRDAYDVEITKHYE